MKIFLDVGAHVGESLRAAKDPAYAFDRIECFEPVLQCCDELLKFGDPRVRVHRFGLLDHTADQPIYNPGHLGASVFADARANSTSVMASFRRASDWFRDNVSDSDEVYLKLNCEGSECDIIDDLVGSGEIRKVKAVLVHYDVRKIPSQVHRESETRDLLGEIDLVATGADEVFKASPTYFAGLQGWLDQVGARTHRRKLSDLPTRARFWWIPWLVRSLRLSQLMKAILPRSFYRGVVSRFKGYDV